MSYLGGSLQVIDIGTSTQRVCEPDAVGGPKNCLWNIGLPLRYLSIISRVTGNSGVKVSCAFVTTNDRSLSELPRDETRRLGAGVVGAVSIGSFEVSR